MTLEMIFFTQLASVFAYVGALFVLYRVLVSQKDATIQLLKEKNEFLELKLTDASQSEPDILAHALSERVKLLHGELGRLSEDKERNREEIAQKERELDQARREAGELSRQIAKAHDLMKEFFCPHCGAPMDERAFQSESVEYEGHEIDIDHEYVRYECGYSLIDGAESRPCKGDKPKQ